MRRRVPWGSALLVACACLLLARGAAFGQSDNPDDYVVIASDSLRLGPLALVASGNVAVNDAGGRLKARARLVSGNGSHLVSDSMTVGPISSVYSVFSNTFVPQGTVTIRDPGQNGPVPFPPPVLLTFPTPVSVAAGVADVKVPIGKTITLGQGTYGNCKVARRGTMILTGGVYNCQTLRLGTLGRLLFSAPTVLNIANLAIFGQLSVIGPIGSTTQPTDVQINFAGTVLRIGRRTTFAAQVSAPQATVSVGSATLVKGQIVARDVTFGTSAVIQSVRQTVGVFEARTMTPTNTPPPTSTASPTETPTVTSTETATPTASASYTPTNTPVPTPTNTATATSTDTPRATFTDTPVPTSTFTPTGTQTPTATPSDTPLPTNTAATVTGTPCEGVCGDGIVDCGEDCDDGAANGEDGDGCTSECRWKEEASLGLQFCTLSQGAWGAPNGIANGSSGFLTMHPDILPITLGGPGQSLTLLSQSAVMGFMPTGGTPHALFRGDVDFYSASDVFNDGGGVLAGQTLALSLAVGLSHDLGAGDLAAMVLPTTPFCTQGLTAGSDGVLGTADDQLDPQSQVAGPYTVPSDIAVANNDVGTLLAVTNQYLRGATSTVSASDLNTALTTLNEAFDGCRRIVPCP
jgi:hypothetical protein